MQKLKFINSRGDEFQFNETAPFVFWKISGLELPPVTTVHTQAAGQHGYTIHEILLESRTIRLTGHIHGVGGTEEMYALRKRLNAVCSPVLGLGELQYQNDAGLWKAAAFCKQNPYADKVHSIQTLEVVFECPSPFWTDKEPTVVGLSYVKGGLTFPLRTPTIWGLLGYRVIAANDGDCDAPLEFYIEGGAVNPVITNKTTGKFLKLDKHVNEGESLYINTDPEKQEASLIKIDPVTNMEVKENAYGYLTFDSDFKTLAPGNNEIIFNSDDETKNVRIRIQYYKRYVGV